MGRALHGVRLPVVCFQISALVPVAVIYIVCSQVVGSFREVNLEKQLSCRVLLCSLSTDEYILAGVGSDRLAIYGRCPVIILHKGG